MRVFIVGGSGEFGVPTVRTIAGLDEVTEVAIAARNLDRAREAARGCGPKVEAVQVDATDVDALTAAMRGFDVVLNTSNGETMLPAIRAAIAARVNYCDILSATDAHAQLDAAAREAGITAITGIGVGAGLFNILLVCLGVQLDDIRELQVMASMNLYLGRPRLCEVLEAGDNASEIRRELLADCTPYGSMGSHLGGRKVDAIEFYLSLPWQRPGTSRALGFVGGRWQDVDPVGGAAIPALGLHAPPVRPFSVQSDSFVMPRHGWPPRASRAVIYVTGLSRRLNEQMAAQADRIAAGQISGEDAASEVRLEVSSDPTGWLLPILPDRIGLYALGFKEGRPAVVSAVSQGLFGDANRHMSTVAPLVVAARRVWRGQVEQKGVLLPEAIFEYRDFEPEVIELLPSPPPHGRLVVERMEFLA